ncbi:MAG: hypothetical protein IPK82_18865 [Polyangiaceae bacterium]|nr:hypothetical protein [Polyangiaceae bacterium]
MVFLRSLPRWPVLAVFLPLLAGCSSTLPAAAPEHPQNEAAASTQTLHELALGAASPDETTRNAAIIALRAAGQPGLDALFEAHAAVIARLTRPDGPATDDDAIRVRYALEKVSRQRDVHASRLYWYTNLNDARAEAQKTGKPILSLRLLGNLDDELSCANSRFFRTALYPDQNIGKRLRQSFVLHWQSERPAPKVTIDFGDGRKLERTVTGNSIHYVLNSKGHLLDAIPGMYGPAAFLQVLNDALELHVRTMLQSDDERRETVRAFHAEKRDNLARAWANYTGLPVVPPNPRSSEITYPPAFEAVATAVPKAAVETPIVQAVQANVVPLPVPGDTPAWNAVVDSFTSQSHLDANAKAFMRSKVAADVDSTGRVVTPLDNAAFERKLQAFERAVGEDTARNEFSMHRVLHDWLAMTPPPEELESFNTRVYASLFLTPRADPWLGLLLKDVYSGIEREGVKLDRQATGPQSGAGK